MALWKIEISFHFFPGEIQVAMELTFNKVREGRYHSKCCHSARECYLYTWGLPVTVLQTLVTLKIVEAQLY